MRPVALLTAFLLLQCLFIPCHSQDFKADDTLTKTDNPIPYGLSEKNWDKVQKIWNRKSLPVIHLSNNTLTKGQILYMNDTMLVFWADARSFYNPFESDSLLRVFKSDSIGNIMAGRALKTELKQPP